MDRKPTMLAQRLVSAIIAIPIAVIFAWFGGWPLTLLLVAALGFASWEYWHMFVQGGYRPSAVLLVVGTACLLIARYLYQFQGSDLLISLLVMIALIVQVFEFEKGKNTSAQDFNITLGGVLYLGWLGAYIISLRSLPDGMWWLILVIPATALGDGAAYLVGRRFGKHKISQRVSPNKSWEGYIAGFLATALGGMLLASLWHLRSPFVTFDKGLILGLVIGLTSLIGDLGESMLKRSFGVKDASRLIPGHGGVMDRVDSWLWAAPVGYYLIVLLWM